MTAIPARMSQGHLPGRRREVSVVDRRIARSLRKRDPEAMALVMQSHGRTLLGYLEGTLRDRALAEDVLQQTLLEIWRRGADFDPQRSGLLSWALMIARSRALDALRRRVPLPIDPATIERTAVVQPDHADRLLEQWLISGLLARIPGEEASLLRMRFYDGLSQSEIAQTTGIALGTVKARMVRGLERLRSLLEAEEGGR